MVVAVVVVVSCFSFFLFFVVILVAAEIISLLLPGCVMWRPVSKEPAEGFFTLLKRK